MANVTKLDDINRWLTLCANLGVIAGIVFLALELRQNQRMVMAQTRNEIARASIEMQQFNQEPSQRRAILRVANGESLSDEDIYQFRRWASVWLEHWENVDYQYRQGLFAEEEYQAHLNKVRAILPGANGGIGEYFCERRARFTPDFVSTMDKLLVQPCSDIGGAER